MSVNIKLGDKTISGVDSIRVEDADNSGTWDKFALYKKPIDPDADVLFYDYDGTILYSYTKEEFLALTAMPPNPTHTGLTAQGWNATLQEAQDYVTDVGELDVGQLYITDDGKTRLYMDITSDTAKDVPLCFAQTVQEGVKVNWGDGSAEEVFTGTSSTEHYVTTSHSYSTVGKYVITFEPIGNCQYALRGFSTNLFGVYSSPSQGFGNYVYNTYLRKVEFGNNIQDTGVFWQCGLQDGVTIPNNLTVFTNQCFTETQLRHLNIPSGASFAYVNTAVGWRYFETASFPAKSTVNNLYLGGALGKRVCVPKNNYTTVALMGKNANARTQKILIPSITFTNASVLQNFFAGLSFLENIVSKISIDCDVSTYNGCQSLTDVKIPNNITYIRSSCFENCYSLSGISFPSTVVEIGSKAFYNCYGLLKYDFTNAVSVPTLININAFGNLYSTSVPYQILVPASLYDEWKAASNWSALASHIVSVS